MCAWRYAAGGAAGADSTAVPSPFATGLAGNALSNSSATAFLRTSAAGNAGVGMGGGGVFGSLGVSTATVASRFPMTAGAAASTLAAVGQQQGMRDPPSEYDSPHSDDEEDEVDDDEEGGSRRGRPGYAAESPVKPTKSSTIPPVATASLATAFMKNTTRDGGVAGAKMATAADANAQRTAQIAASLSRQLFKAKIPSSSGGAALAAPLVDVRFQDEIDEEELELLSTVDRAFVKNTQDLFDDVDAELLSEDFVPHEHVVGIIALDETGDEASPDEIDENLMDYRELESEIDADLGDYIDAHHEEFNNAIRDFSEMVLAVSGSDDTLAQFKKELADAVGSLESHAQELKVLRLRAAKSLFMADALGHMQQLVAIETEVKELVQSRHYLAAVRKLETQARLLGSEELRGVRAVQALRDTHTATVSTLHHAIVEDLLACVFRQDRLVEADAQLLQEMLENSERDSKDANAAAPNVQHTVNKYWKLAGVDGVGAEGEEEDDGGCRPNAATADGPATAAGAPKERTLATLIETLFDDPRDGRVASRYLKFVPLCVKSLRLLGQLDYAHELFFSRATRSMERFVAHFLRLYDAWRRRTRSGAGLNNGETEAAVRGIYVRALDLANDLISFDEAVATIQAHDLRAMLGALFTELEKILRNAEYFQKIVLVSQFPFIAPFVVKPIPFDAAVTSPQWHLMDYPLRDAIWLHDTLRTALDCARIRLGEDPLIGDEAAYASSSLSSTSRTQANGPGKGNNDDVMEKFLEFFRVETVLATLQDNGGSSANVEDTVHHTEASPSPKKVAAFTSNSAAGAGNGTKNSSFLLLQRCCGFLTLQKISDAVEGACAQVRAKYPAMQETHLRHLQQAFTAELRDAVRVKLVAEVRSMQQQWDLQALWSQLNYHIEIVFQLICDATESPDEADDAVTLAPFLRQKNLMGRMQRTTSMMRDAERLGEDTSTLDRLLTTYDTGGLLKLIEDTGTVSFSMTGAVKKAQGDIRKANEGQARQFKAMQSDAAKLMALADSGRSGGGGLGGPGAPLVLLHTTLLRRWFVFTAMNALSCYECASRFYSRSCDRVPAFRLLNEEDCVVGFFKRFLRATYIPTLFAFHSQQLQQLCINIGDNSGVSGTDAAPSSFAMGSPAGGKVANSSTAAGGWMPRGGSTPTNGSSGVPATLNTLSGAWPTVAVDDLRYPILACVQYVGQVLAKVSDVRRVLPDSLTEEVEQNTSEALIMELVVFLKRQVQWLGRGTLAQRLLHQPFEDAFAGIPNPRWAALVDEGNIDEAHRYIDMDLYRYYQLNSEERTSGHEYNDAAVSTLDAMQTLEATFALELASRQGGGGGGAAAAESVVDRYIGRIDPHDLCIRDDSTLVAFALLCTSVEWLSEALLRYLWPQYRSRGNYTDCCVPGSRCLAEMRFSEVASVGLASGNSSVAHKVRLSGYLSRLVSVAQVSLLHLSVEARFLAFGYVPQLRDTSYDVVAVSSAADTFVQAYARRMHSFYAILRQHLHPNKLKFTCLTAGKPAGELILMELAHLRDKAISQAGWTRLWTDLRVMQTTLQLVLPTDGDVRAAVARYFMRPALFLRYIFNKDVVNEIVSSLDYRNFSTKEVELLIRLVFRQVSGANDDTLAVQQIEVFHRKLQAMQDIRRVHHQHQRRNSDLHNKSSSSNPSFTVDARKGVSSFPSSPPPLPPPTEIHSMGMGKGANDRGVLPQQTPLKRLATKAAAVAAAAMDDADEDNHADNSDERSAEDLESTPPPLPLLSASRSRTASPAGAAVRLPLATSNLPTVPKAAPPAAPSGRKDDEGEEEEDEEEEDEEEEGEEEEDEESSVAARGDARRPPQFIPNDRASRHVDPTISASPAGRGPVMSQPAQGLPAVPPISLTSLRHAGQARTGVSGGSSALPSSPGTAGIVEVENSEEEYEEYEEGEYEEEEETEEEETEEEETEEEEAASPPAPVLSKRIPLPLSSKSPEAAAGRPSGVAPYPRR